ncbi:MAG: hypothetical protein JXA78_14465, partial [Anaerolineales bacterium]|nr:hypothetical protein [Anaerolineales bacterium]
MISDLGQSRIPKRKDRFKLEYAIFLVVVVIFGLVWLFPEQAGSLPAAWFGVIFALFFGLWILSMLYTFYQWRSWHAAWQQIAEQLGVNFDTHKSKQALIFRWPRISGAYRGRSLDIQRFMRRYGRNVKFYTSIHV